jgi:hypothetical protein
MKSDNWVVVLDRGKALPPRVFSPASKRRAYRRAMALCDLHSCGYNRGNRKLTVLAGAYYNEKHKGDEQ